MAWIKEHKRTTGTVTAVLLFLLMWWALSYGGDGQLAKVQDLRNQLRGDAGKKLAPEQRRDLWKQLNDEMKQLSPEQRRTLAKQQNRAMTEKFKKFFSQSKSQQLAQLDADINRMEAARKKWEQNKKSGSSGFGGNGPGGAGKGPAGGKSLDPQQREHMRKERLEQTTPELRAMTSEYFRMLKDRREQRGLPPSGKGPGR
jgi:uncharacterized membrane protein